MKEVELKRKSIHHYIARFGDRYQERDLSNICSYIKAMASGGFLFLLASAAVVFCAICFGDLFAWLVAGILNGWTSLNTLGGIPLVVMGTMAFLFLIAFIVDIIHQFRKRRAKQERSQPGILALAYKSWKEKICFKIKLVG